MPCIDAIKVIGTEPEQLIARVSLERSELIIHGDVFPHYLGRQYRALGSMHLIDGPDGQWKSNGHGADARLVEVIVQPVEPGKARGWGGDPVRAAAETRERMKKQNGRASPEQIRLLNGKALVGPSDKAAE